MTSIDHVLVHGTAVAVAVDADGPLAGVVFLGDPGAGKTTTALCLIESCPWRRSRLIGDDQTYVSAINGELIVEAPKAIAGALELRGFGPISMPHAKRLSLVIAFMLSQDTERLPEAGQWLPISGSDAYAPLYPLLGRAPEVAAKRARFILRAILAGQ